MNLICEVCGETIAMCDDRKLTIPLIGGMFQSADPLHGVPAPFHDSLGWEDFKCPWGGHRPILEPDRILTDEGHVYLRGTTDAPAGPRVVCPKCFPGEVAEVALQIIEIENRGERITRLVKVTGETNQFCPIHGEVTQPLIVDPDKVLAQLREEATEAMQGGEKGDLETEGEKTAPEDGPQAAIEKADDGNIEGNSQFKCEICGKDFAKKHYLANHMRSHK